MDFTPLAYPTSTHAATASICLLFIAAWQLIAIAWQRSRPSDEERLVEFVVMVTASIPSLIVWGLGGGVLTALPVILSHVHPEGYQRYWRFRNGVYAGDESRPIPDWYGLWVQVVGLALAHVVLLTLAFFGYDLCAWLSLGFAAVPDTIAHGSWSLRKLLTDIGDGPWYSPNRWHTPASISIVPASAVSWYFLWDLYTSTGEVNWLALVGVTVGLAGAFFFEFVAARFAARA